MSPADFFQDEVKHDAVEWGDHDPGNRITCKKELQGMVVRGYDKYPEDTEKARADHCGSCRQNGIAETSQTAAGNIHDRSDEKPR